VYRGGLKACQLALFEEVKRQLSRPSSWRSRCAPLATVRLRSLVLASLSSVYARFCRMASWLAPSFFPISANDMTWPSCRLDVRRSATIASRSM